MERPPPACGQMAGAASFSVPSPRLLFNPPPRPAAALPTLPNPYNYDDSIASTQTTAHYHIVLARYRARASQAVRVNPTLPPPPHRAGRRGPARRPPFPPHIPPPPSFPAQLARDVIAVLQFWLAAGTLCRLTLITSARGSSASTDARTRLRLLDSHCYGGASRAAPLLRLHGDARGVAQPPLAACSAAPRSSARLGRATKWSAGCRRCRRSQPRRRGRRRVSPSWQCTRSTTHRPRRSFRTPRCGAP
eukprot:362504-Chlamydomonas_euryale.AAC.14